MNIYRRIVIHGIGKKDEFPPRYNNKREHVSGVLIALNIVHLINFFSFLIIGGQKAFKLLGLNSKMQVGFFIFVAMVLSSVIHHFLIVKNSKYLELAVCFEKEYQIKNKTEKRFVNYFFVYFIVSFVVFMLLLVLLIPMF